MSKSKFDKRVNAFDNVSVFNITLAKVINILLQQLYHIHEIIAKFMIAVTKNGNKNCNSNHREFEKGSISPCNMYIVY